MLSRGGLTTLAALAAFLIDYANAQGGVLNLDITNELVSPDGFERLAVLAGGTLPGPLISTSKGSRVRVNVRNELVDREMLKSTSIHWHGMFQRGTAWADGPTFITQCPIAPGQSFLYDFSPAEQTNTFWYHSHHELQYCDGLRGPMVIYDAQDPLRHLYDVDDESTIISLMDWFHLPTARLTGVPRPDSTLINGKGRYAGGPSAPLSIVNVDRGKRYRMRLISMACDANYVFSIDQHKLVIIEADGVNTQAQPVDSVQIFAGQRYSFVLRADQIVGNYWIRANPNIGTKEFEGGINSAILRYKDAAIEDPKSTRLASPSLLRESSLQPLDDPAAPGVHQLGAADININLVMGSAGRNFTINGARYESPSTPLLAQIMDGARDPRQLLPAGSVYTLEKNKVVEITLTGSAPGAPHPFHLHGHTFSIIQGPGDTSPNFVNPPRRDVVSSGPSGSTVIIRFETDNAGPWMFHCHIEFHLIAGLAVVFAEDNPGTANDAVPQAWSQLCPIYEQLDDADARAPEYRYLPPTSA